MDTNTHTHKYRIEKLKITKTQNSLKIHIEIHTISIQLAKGQNFFWWKGIGIFHVESFSSSEKENAQKLLEIFF